LQSARPSIPAELEHLLLIRDKIDLTLSPPGMGPHRLRLDRQQDAADALLLQAAAANAGGSSGS
jgi:hypothetical protein